MYFKTFHRLEVNIFNILLCKLFGHKESVGTFLLFIRLNDASSVKGIEKNILYFIECLHVVAY